MTSPKTGPSTPGLHFVYIPAVCAIILFHGYYSQYLFNSDPDLAPGPLTRRESLTFNTLLACLCWNYYRACTVDPGRYRFPPSATSSSPPADPNPLKPTTRWCKKCARPKPLRAHHCRHCGRCVPKMDHHCPWTGNCVSLQTFPHFLRFLLYTNLSLWYLAALLYRRAAAVWADRHLPAYLGPSLHSLIGLALLSLSSGASVLALGILLYTTVRGWAFNSTMIEDWEMERHEAVLARMDEDNNNNNNHLWDDDDAALRELLDKIEFPYDLGVFANMAQAMGTRNPLRWFLPVFGGAPVVNNEIPGQGAGWEWEENGFNDLPGLWPPPDPEKVRQARRGAWPGAAAAVGQGQDYTYDNNTYQTPEEVKAAFAQRQEEDLLRRRRAQAQQARQRSGIVAELEEWDDLGATGVARPSWTNSDGDRLWDYGVDEAVEEELIPVRGDDEDVPLAELIRRRKVRCRDEDD
ncbi:zf-DHHC-domain-containing protein [Parathielavia hyrcaniae]|uniref:Palmitoyltransferase PFA4 n=1 Tax=Parathielavia hyrcaniae TaxID=113614 RepID=A0AAN6T593_9PEZI|nr:zf-DHHC-domain-containing protein [Parathielavia hyrcaniae]